MANVMPFPAAPFAVRVAKSRSSHRNGTSGVAYSRVHAILPSAGRDLCPDESDRAAPMQKTRPDIEKDDWRVDTNSQSQADWRQSHSIAGNPGAIKESTSVVGVSYFVSVPHAAVFTAGSNRGTSRLTSVPPFRASHPVNTTIRFWPGKDHQFLPAESSGHPGILSVRRNQPPAKAVIEPSVLHGIRHRDVGRDRLFHPILGYDPFVFPQSIVQIEEPE